MIAVFFSASWQQGDLCLLYPDKNSSTSVRREPNIGVRRSRTAMGDCCISMPTMFSVPGGTPSAGIAKGDAPLASFLPYLSRSKDRVGGRGAKRPRLREGPPKAAHRSVSQRPPIPPPAASPREKGTPVRSGGPGWGRIPPGRPQRSLPPGPPGSAPSAGCRNTGCASPSAAGPASPRP